MILKEIQLKDLKPNTDYLIFWIDHGWILCVTNFKLEIINYFSPASINFKDIKEIYELP